MTEKHVYRKLLMVLLVCGIFSSLKIYTDATTMSVTLSFYDPVEYSKFFPAHELDLYVTNDSSAIKSLYYEVREFCDVKETEPWSSGTLLTNGIVAPGSAVGTVDQGGSYLVYNVNLSAVKMQLGPYSAVFGAVGGAVMDNREGDDLRSTNSRSVEMINKINELNQLVAVMRQEALEYRALHKYEMEESYDGIR